MTLKLIIGVGESVMVVKEETVMPRYEAGVDSLGVKGALDEVTTTTEWGRVRISSRMVVGSSCSSEVLRDEKVRFFGWTSLVGFVRRDGVDIAVS